VAPSSVSEALLAGESPEAHAERLSVEKASAVAESHPDAIVIAGDTVVVLGGEVLGKPADEEQAVDMLASLSGRTHQVVSGLALAFPDGHRASGFSTTLVTFRSFDVAFARRYVGTGEPMDKAGAYGIQGLGSALVQAIEGEYHTVMGLPIPLLLTMLEDGGWRYEIGRLSRSGGS
jgi:septum formation protein